MRRAVLTLLMLLAFAAVARAQADWGLGVAGQLIDVRMEGFVGPAPSGVNPQATWKLDVEGKTYPFALTDLVVLDGNLLPGDIINRVAPNPIAFEVAGTRKAIAVFKAASATTKITFTGAIDPSGPVPILMMSRAAPVDAPAPSK